MSVDEKTKQRMNATHARRIKAIKKAANGCWWVEQYLMDSCGVTTNWRKNDKR